MPQVVWPSACPPETSALPDFVLYKVSFSTLVPASCLKVPLALEWSPAEMGDGK